MIRQLRAVRASACTTRRHGTGPSGAVALDGELHQGARPDLAGERGDDEPARPHLVDVRGRYVAQRARREQPVERCRLGPPRLAVVAAQIRPVAGRMQRRGSVRGERGVELDAEHSIVAERLGQQRHDVPRRGADLQHAGACSSSNNRATMLGREFDDVVIPGPSAAPSSSGIMTGSSEWMSACRSAGEARRVQQSGSCRHARAGMNCSRYGIPHAAPCVVEQTALVQNLHERGLLAQLGSRHDVSPPCPCQSSVPLLGALPSGDGGVGGGVHGLSLGCPACLPLSLMILTACSGGVVHR